MLHSNAQSAINAVKLATDLMIDIFQIKPTRPDKYTTNSFHLVSQLTDENLENFTQSIKQAVSRSLLTAPERALADFAISEAYRDKQAFIYQSMANLHQNSSLVDFFEKLTDSKDDIAVLQSDVGRTIVTSGYVKDMQRLHLERESAIANLKNMLVPSAIPQASAEDWRKSVSTICKFIKVPTGKGNHIKVARTQAVSMFNSLGCNINGKELDDNVVQQLINVVVTLNKLQQNGKLKDVVTRIGTELSTDDLKRLAAQNGDVETEILWSRVVTALQGTDIAAENLEALRPTLSESLTLSASDSTCVSVSGDSLTDRIGQNPVADTGNDEVTEASAKTRLLSMNVSDDAGYSESKALTGEYHNLARVAHILLTADVDIDFFNRSSALGGTHDRASASVPAVWFAHNSFVKEHFAEMYRGHIPTDLTFTVFDRMVDYMQRAPHSAIVVQKVLADLSRALREDITAILESVHAAAKRISNVDTDAIIKKVDGKKVRYTQLVMSQHPERVLRSTTTIEDFLLSDLVVVDSNLPLRVTANPTARGLGFAESMIGYDVEQMYVVNRSVSMVAVGDLFNSVQNHKTAVVNALDLHFAPRNRMKMAFADMARGVRVESKGDIKTVLCSEVCKGMAFDNPEYDFHAQVVAEETLKFSVMLGQHSVEHKRFTVGNIWGTFSFGVVKPSYEHNGNNIEGCFAKLGYDVLKSVANDYFMAPVDVIDDQKHQVVLDEENGKYVDRLATLDDSFVDVSLGNKDRLRRLSAMRALNHTTFNIIRPEDVDLISRYDVKVRQDVQGIVELVADRHCDRLFAFHQPALIDLFYRSLTTVLSTADRALLRQPEVTEHLAGICSSINAVLPAGDKERFLALYYFDGLMENIRIRLATPQVVAMIEAGHNPMTLLGGVSYAASDITL